MTQLKSQSANEKGRIHLTKCVYWIWENKVIELDFIEWKEIESMCVRGLVRLIVVEFIRYHMSHLGFIKSNWNGVENAEKTELLKFIPKDMLR